MTATSAARHRYDPLAEFQHDDAPVVDTRQLFRTLGGVALTASGIAASVWLIYLLHAAVFRPEKLGMLHRLVSQIPEDLVLTIPAGRIELPPAVLPIIAYLLLVSLVAVGARVAVGLVKEGAWLLRHDPPPDAPEPRLTPVPLSTAPADGG